MPKLKAALHNYLIVSDTPGSSLIFELLYRGSINILGTWALFCVLGLVEAVEGFEIRRTR